MRRTPVAAETGLMSEQMVQERNALSFGPYRLIPSERLLTREGKPVELGARALDALITLVGRAQEVVDKRELMERVWPDVTVEEGSLRFHIAGLRKALGDRKDGARYIATLAGRGYSFVAPVSRSTEPAPAGAPMAGARSASRTGATFLPPRLTRMVGRETEVAEIAAQLERARFVTILGPGGVGKTTVAAAVGRQSLERFDGAVLFVDFGLLTDPAALAASVTSMLGISVESDDPLPGLVEWLSDKRLLLILDNCEHVAAAAANLATSIVFDAPQVHILATSREALRAEGEQVHRLAPLAVPPEAGPLSAAETLAFPSAQLFMERLAANGVTLELDDADAAIVARICRKLDGIALAIELAAGRVAAFGLHQTAELLDQHLALFWQGQRTAPPRQQTLQATFDWSYELLSQGERQVLQCLAVFVGNFTLDAALAVVTGEEADHAFVIATIDSLIAKSMVTTRPAGAMMRYRLLDTTRAYARALATDPAEHAALATRHARYYQRWLAGTQAEWTALADAPERTLRLADLGNVRAALEWAFGEQGDAALGIALAAAAAPAFLATALLSECVRWCRRALQLLGDAAGDQAMRSTLQRSLALAERSAEA